MSPVHILSPQSTLLPNITVAFALLGTAAGTAALLYPQEAIKNFGLKPLAVSDDTRDFSNAMIQVYGVRNACTGLTNFALWYLGRDSTGAVRIAWRQALGVMFITNVAVPFVDGYVTRRQGGSSPWMHWIFVPITFGIGSALLATQYDSL